MDSERKIRELSCKLQDVFDNYHEEQIKNDNLTGELNKRQKILDERSEIINILRKQVLDYESTIVELETNSENLKDKGDRLEKRVSALEKELDECHQIRSQLEISKDELTKQYESRTKQYESRTKQTEQLAVDLLNARIKLEETEKKCYEMKEVNDQLSSQLQVLNAHKRLQLPESPLVKMRARQCNSPLYSVNSPTTLNPDANNFESLASFNDIQITEYQELNDRLQKELTTLTSTVEAKEKECIEAKQKIDMISRQLDEKEKKIQQISNELSVATRPMADHDINLLVQELYDLRAQVKSANHRATELSRNEELENVKKELDLVESSWKAEKLHKERYAKENLVLERQLHDLKRDFNAVNQRCTELIERNQQLMVDINQARAASPEASVMSNYIESTPIQKPFTCSTIDEPFDTRSVKKDVRVPVGTASNLTIADEVGEMMNSTALPTRMPPPPPSQTMTVNCNGKLASENLHSDYKFNTSKAIVDNTASRYDRMTELARRNRQQKPLHRSTYALELDTFDQVALSENDFKRGRVLPRPALADQSNHKDDNNNRNEIINNRQTHRIAKPCAFIVN